MWLILQQAEPEDFVIATGEQHSVRDFVNAAAEELGMRDPLGRAGRGREGLRRARPLHRLGRPALLPSDRGRDPAGRPDQGARRSSAGSPKTDFKQLVAEMVREDLKSAERDELVKKHGYSAYDYHE